MPFNSQQRLAAKHKHQKDGLCRDCNLPAVPGIRKCQKHREMANKLGKFRNRQHSINRNRQLKHEVINAYGGECECCGETRFEFLQVDHRYGGGGEHRKVIKQSIYVWLKNRNYPKDEFRLLCGNCNSSRGYYGYCPHELEMCIFEVAA